ncbi:ATP-binding protein [Magnetovibrio sp. PR-2]|uniref:sensor histidine kinase n=1 Tax=Magnetovibrio sp. PR-2 TaxID=3120356 RepID=UPI002FCE2A83
MTTIEDELNALREENALLRQQLGRRDDALFHTVLDTIPVRVFWKDLEGRVIGCNRLYAIDAGFEHPREVIGLRDQDMSWRARADQYLATNEEIITSGQPKLGYEEPYLNKDGQETWLRKSKSPLRDEHGDIIGVLGIYEDVTKRKQAENALTNAKVQAENANMAKSQFLSSMSHELRTPLNAILGFAQHLEGDPHNPLNADQLESAGHIITGGRHLMELITEILELAKIEAGHLNLKPEALDLVEILYETLPLVQGEAEKKSVELKLPAVGRDVPKVMVDLKRAKQVLLNLLTNAVKYNVEGGSVTLDSEREGDFVTITVTDTGIGMSPEGLQTLFTPFSRLGQENTDIEGTGIGLVITQDLVCLMGGEIGVKSELGKGSTFWVKLPVAPHK